MCYSVPAAGAIVSGIIWARTKNVKVWWLNLMFIGGSLFGVIDHIWNGELFYSGRNIVNDLTLGVVITGFILSTWSIVVLLSRYSPTLKNYLFIQK